MTEERVPLAYWVRSEEDNRGCYHPKLSVLVEKEGLLITAKTDVCKATALSLFPTGEELAKCLSAIFTKIIFV